MKEEEEPSVSAGGHVHSQEAGDPLGAGSLKSGHLKHQSAKGRMPTLSKDRALDLRQTRTRTSNSIPGAVSGI